MVISLVDMFKDKDTNQGWKFFLCFGILWRDRGEKHMGVWF